MPDRRYFRDPTHVHTDAYKRTSQLAQWNGEGVRNMSDDKVRYGKTSKFVWVRGTADTVVWPNRAEQWDVLNDDYPANLTVLPMAEAAWYVDDPFGLRTAQEGGKNFFEEYPGNHLRFSTAALEGWLDKYFLD